MSITEGEELGHSEPDWFRYDDQGMIVPHSILGSLEDFRRYLEIKGNTELLKKIPNSSHSSQVIEKQELNVVKKDKTTTPTNKGIFQSNALEHWNTHMRLRREQQDNLSGLLSRPVENLLMNQANRFRETQEKREMLNKVLPLVYSGYGHCVGSAFWRLPQRYGDETSGIATTLTKTERGIREPSAQVGLPYCIRQESGISQAEPMRHASRAWDQSVYLKQQCQELSEIIQDLDFKRPDIDKLEVIGSCKPFSTDFINSSTTVEEKNKEEDSEDLHEDMVPQSNDVQSENKDLQGPALRIGGQLARWTGNSNTEQGHVGISSTIFFECLTGEIKSSHLKMSNDGSTAIFYNWQELPLPQNLPHLLKHTKTPHFYFNSSSGVILPGETKHVEFIFKSERPGIQREVWQLNTHPLLLQGASIQVTLRGVALYQDKNRDHRLFIEAKLEKIVTEKICQSIVYEMVHGIHTPERPSSPAELHQTEEQEFQAKNPKFCYVNQPVEELKKLWNKAKPGSTWDFSINTFRQVLLSLPHNESAYEGLTREAGLAQLNSLLLQLSEPLPKQLNPTVATLGQLLWRDPLDTMTSEAVRLRHLLHLPEKDTWMDKKEEKREEALISDHEVTGNLNKDKTEKKGGTSTKDEKHLTLPESKPGTSVKLNEDMKKKGVFRTDLGKHRKDKHKEAASTTDLHLQTEHIPEDHTSHTNMEELYKRLLHQTVYKLMENLVDSLCDLTEELQVSH